MALFGKKPSAEDIIKMFNALDDEDKEAIKKSIFGEKAEDLEKAEDEREEDKIEEEKTEAPEVKDEKKEEVEEESKEIDKDVEEASSDEVVEGEKTEETEPEATDEVKAEEVDEADVKENDDRHEEVMDGIIARLSALEEKFNAFLAEEEKEPEHKDFGFSGVGKRGVTGEEDHRTDDIVKKLGGLAF